MKQPISMFRRDFTKQRPSDLEALDVIPPLKTFQCSRFFCMHDNPPQIAEGRYQCFAVYGGKRCSGSYEVPADVANACYMAHVRDARIADQLKQREEERRTAREARIRKNAEQIAEYKEELDLWMVAFDNRSPRNYTTLCLQVQMREGIPYSEARETLERQMRWLTWRTAWLKDEIEELERQNAEEEASRTPKVSEKRLSVDTLSSFYVIESDECTDYTGPGSSRTF